MVIRSRATKRRVPGLPFRPDPWRTLVVDDSQRAAQTWPRSSSRCRRSGIIARSITNSCGFSTQGCRAIRLTGASGQRLLASGLRGPWAAVIEVAGNAGPELAAGMDAPDLTLVCRGSVGDGGASRLTAGRVLIMGRADPAFGYAQRGGLAMVAGNAGARAGLRQRGGDLILIGCAGPLCGECQSGGRLLTLADVGSACGSRTSGRTLHPDRPDRPAC